MKRLSVQDLKSEDCLRLIFEGAYEPQASRGGELEPFLQMLEKHAGEWMPDVVGGKRERKYSRAALWKELEERSGERYAHCGFYRTKWPALDMSIGLNLPPLPPKLDVSIKVKPLSFFSEENRCRQVVEMMCGWALSYPVIHAFAHSVDDDLLAGAPSFDKVDGVYWLNVFGPKLVETVGRERMLSTPAHRVEQLPNGCVLLVLWPTPVDFTREEARLAQARAHVHLRPDLDFDTVLHTLRERSARLAPVQPRFHPDVAPLLTRVVDATASHKRQHTIAQFNSWQPPEPGEWLPADSVLPSDVDSLERACAHYGDLAEFLVALLHPHVPSVFDATPESLTDADFYFWREEFPQSRLRESIDQRAVPAIGAYLGEVLVRHLGGRWIPRQKLEETQVLVGKRAWLPFVRARHFMRSCQSLLDFSLTQLYLVAARYR